MRMAEFSWDPPPTSGRFGNGGYDEEDSFESSFGFGSQDEKIIIKGQDFDQMLNLASDVKY